MKFEPMAGMSLKSQELVASGRIDWVDYAKGFCIIFVVMMHATLGVEKYAVEAGLAEAGATGWMNWIVTFAQPFRMPDFFLISGLFLGLVIARSWKRYIDRKVVHFLYFYVLWLAIQFSFRSIGWIAEGAGSWEIASNFMLALIEPYGTLWFIYILPVMFIGTRLLENVNWIFVLCGAALLEIAPVHTSWTVIDEFASRFVYFYAGYVLAGPIFNLANWARHHVSKALMYLIIWAAINGYFTFTKLPNFLSLIYSEYSFREPENLAQLPLVSLALGAAGAVAVVCLCALFSQFRIAGVLRYLGSHSIVVYLAFFLPMVVSRQVLFHFAPWIDLGTMSLIVLVTSIVSAMIAWEFTRLTGWFRFLFVRPNWACIYHTSPADKRKASLQPAE